MENAVMENAVIEAFQEIVANCWGIPKTFKEFVDSIPPLRYPGHSFEKFLRDRRLFDDLSKNNALTKSDLKYLLNKITNKCRESFEYLEVLCKNNNKLLKYILKEFVLDKEIVDNFNKRIEAESWREDRNIHTIFELIEYHQTNQFGNKNEAEEILKLNELNRCVCSFDLNKNQKLELIELLKDNEVAQNRLKEVIENQLESNYDFDSLMSYLKKQEKKNLLNI